MSLIKFERPLILFGILILIILHCFYRYLSKRFERGVTPEDLRSWMISARGNLRAFIQRLSVVVWPKALLIGLSAPYLFLSQSSLPLHNAAMIVILDTSESMRAEEDVFGEGGRFGAAKRETIETLAPLTEENIRPRMGLVLMAGVTTRSLVLYEDYGVFIQQVMQANIFPKNVQGTNYAAALKDALDLCDSAVDLLYCSVVMVTDGDREKDVDPELFSSILPKFPKKKYRLDIIGVGKNEAPLPPGKEGQEFNIDETGDKLTVPTTKYDKAFLDEMVQAAGSPKALEFGERGLLKEHLKKIQETIKEEVQEKTKRWVDISEYCYMVSAFFLFIYLVSLLPFGRIKADWFRERQLRK